VRDDFPEFAKYCNPSCWFLPPVRCKRGVAQWAAGVNVWVTARYCGVLAYFRWLKRSGAQFLPERECE
jgi:hypothetical protein